MTREQQIREEVYRLGKGKRWRKKMTGRNNDAVVASLIGQLWKEYKQLRMCVLAD